MEDRQNAVKNVQAVMTTGTVSFTHGREGEANLWQTSACRPKNPVAAVQCVHWPLGSTGTSWRTAVTTPCFLVIQLTFPFPVITTRQPNKLLRCMQEFRQAIRLRCT